MNTKLGKRDRPTEARPLIPGPAKASCAFKRPNGVAGRPRILIVDDNIIFLKAMSMKLGTEGYDVGTAVDGATAVSMVRQTKPDLILLDINFPPDVGHGGGVPWNGLNILEWLRRIDEAKGVPVILVSGEDLEKHRDQYLATGVADHFLKPVDNDELLAAIKRNLDATMPAEPSEPEEPEEPADQPASKKILFVDDEGDWRYMVALYLTECGYDVVTAEDDAEALRKAGETEPDLVILDLNLGGRSALTLMKLLSLGYPQAPILVYTGMELDEPGVQNLLNQGAYQYLRKGTMEEMLNAVSEAINVQLEPAPEPDGEMPMATVEPPPAPVESILVVEDDLDFGDALRLYLEAHSFSVTRVIDGAEGLRQILAADFDFVLCDMVMPTMAGAQFYQAVQDAKPELCKRFIFMTGHQADPKTDQFVRRVRGLMLWKPFSLPDILTAADIIRRKNPSLASRLA
ncbi:MAG TPA: response regulator [Candidatus Binatia bacterium]|jgi:CheY-like chemotaxis protein|nr:response regulator [Candidatus Binatia bacterium]